MSVPSILNLAPYDFRYGVAYSFNEIDPLNTVFAVFYARIDAKKFMATLGDEGSEFVLVRITTEETIEENE